MQSTRSSVRRLIAAIRNHKPISPVCTESFGVPSSAPKRSAIAGSAAMRHAMRSVSRVDARDRMCLHTNRAGAAQTAPLMAQEVES